MYEEVVKQCEHCNLKHAKPSRSRLSGMRAATFGALLFLDHVEVKLFGTTYHVLLIVDASSSFLAAYAQLSLDAGETVDQFREWMET